MLPNLRLTHSFHDQQYEIKAGNWLLYFPTNNRKVDLGQMLHPVAILAHRFKAMQVSEPGCNGNKPVKVYYDTESSGYKRIKAQAERIENRGHYMTGIELLLLLPNHGLVTYYVASKTGKRIVANALKSLSESEIQSTVWKFTVDQRENTKFRWFQPQIDSTDFLWKPAKIKSYQRPIDEFNNPESQDDVEAFLDRAIRFDSVNWNQVLADGIRKHSKALI